jgi:Tfp pilus assembly protein PilE
MKKGAMFGLDARIALAIFGALSVISGAALYSAIQNAKAEQWRQWFVEKVKATEAYYLDTGNRIAISNTFTDWLYAGDLNNNRENLSYWKGSYVEARTNDGSFLRDGFTSSLTANASWTIILKKTSVWSSMPSGFSSQECTVGSFDCAEWIILSSGGPAGYVNTEAVYDLLDKLVDNNDGKLAGKVRYADDHYLLYRGVNRVK